MSRLQQSRACLVGVCLHSAQWSAPELFETRTAMLSFKTDVYSFGVLMWEILTLREPDAAVSGPTTLVTSSCVC